MKKKQDKRIFELISTAEAAGMAHVSQSQVYNLIEQYNIKACRIGKKIMLDKEGWNHFIQNRIDIGLSSDIED